LYQPSTDVLSPTEVFSPTDGFSPTQKNINFQELSIKLSNPNWVPSRAVIHQAHDQKLMLVYSKSNVTVTDIKVFFIAKNRNLRVPLTLIDSYKQTCQYKIPSLVELGLNMNENLTVNIHAECDDIIIQHASTETKDFTYRSTPLPGRFDHLEP